MKIQSLIFENNQLIPVEVELTLWPGLPIIQFLGLPDQHLKESALRIKSAIKSAGYAFPKAQQILVNLRPSHLKKRSRGLELAVAVAYLWETKQIPKFSLEKNFFVYGELGLDGDVSEPEDLHHGIAIEQSLVLTGSGEKNSRFQKLRIKNLSQLTSLQKIDQKTEIIDNLHLIKRPNDFKNFLFTQEQAKILQILAVGEHSALLAGPSGSGKTTVAKALIEFVRAPNHKDIFNLERQFRIFSQIFLGWRPLVQPHHSTPIMAMIGGGQNVTAGEISRAHGGILILDELLEFPPAVLEALRGPMEEGRISIARLGAIINNPCRSIVIGTTNLCSCGEWTPEKKMNYRCRFSLARCQSYSQRLSGPIVDRFEIMVFMNKGGESQIGYEDLLEKIKSSFEFQDKTRSMNKVNSSLTWADFQQFPNFKQIEVMMPSAWCSQRRRAATLRVARSIADIEESELIKGSHLQKALEWTLFPFEKLQMARS